MYFDPVSVSGMLMLSTAFLPSTPTAGPDKKTEQAGEYKVPEYFQYNELSFYDIDLDMAKYRLKQPTPGEKY